MDNKGQTRKGDQGELEEYGDIAIVPKIQVSNSK